MLNTTINMPKNRAADVNPCISFSFYPFNSRTRVSIALRIS